MVVVADASPIIALAELSRLDILPALFGTLLVPPEVLAELREILGPDAMRRVLDDPKAWVVERAPSKTESLSLHPGETAAICLAIELHADLLIIDEKKGRRVALERKLPIIGTIGILELAADRHLIDLASEFLRLRKSSF